MPAYVTIPLSALERVVGARLRDGSGPPAPEGRVDWCGGSARVSRKLRVLVVSDATGETVERVVRSALVQFENADVEILRRGGIRTGEQVHQVVHEAATAGALLVHTLVSDQLRRLMLETARLHAVDAQDILGPVLDRLANLLDLTPQEKPGLFRQLAEAKSRAIEAVDFAFRHDDGRRVEELTQAELVLVGVSRTMKTPTMLYLAYRGWFVGNVPIVPQVPLPGELTSLPPERVFCLIMSPARLAELRRVRAGHLQMGEDAYASLPEIRQELLYSQDLCLRHRWQRLDVTGKSVEEVAREIVVAAGHLDEDLERSR